jgi:hypothetical protein
MGARVELVAQLPLAVARWAGAAGLRAADLTSRLVERLRRPTLSRMSDEWLRDHEKTARDQER